MAIIFRKTFKLGPLHVTLSKSGIGISLGKAGIRVGANSNGKKTFSATIPATGITIRKSLGNKRK